MAIVAAQMEVQLRSSGVGKVTGELKGLDNVIKASQQGFNTLYEAVSGFAGKAIAGIQNLSGAIGKVGLAGFTAIMGKGAKMAWDQVDAVEQATVALRAYEKDASKVDKVLQDLVAHARSREGKLFMREDLFKAAQGLRVAGDATENLTEHVKVMGRAVAVGMMGWDELTRVIQRVGSTGKLTAIDFEMLTKAGYQLDESVRNSTVTWEELFHILDRGIPADTMGAQADTIRGKLITLNTAIRSLGAAFLGIDADTSRFVDGGLGSRMVGAIDLAIAALGKLKPAAAMVGEAVSTIMDGFDGLASVFQMIPGWMQSGIVGILGVIAGFGMLRQAIAAVTAAMRLMGLGAFTGLLSPLGLAITGVALAGGLLVKSFMDQKAAADAYRASVTDLEGELERLRRQGNDALADSADALRGMFNNDAINEFTEQIEQGEYVLQRFREEYGREFVSGLDDELLRGHLHDWITGWGEFNDQMAITRAELSLTTQEMTELNLKLLDALQDPDINVEAWIEWADGLLTGAESAEELRAAIDLIIETPLSDFSRHAADSMSDLNEEMEKVLATAEDFHALFEKLPATLDDLRIDGQGGLARDLETLHQSLVSSLAPTSEQAKAAAARWMDVLPGDDQQQVIQELADAVELTEDQVKMLGTSWDRIMTGMQSGTLDNTRLMQDFRAILEDTDLAPDQQIAKINELSLSLSDYVDWGKQFSEEMREVGFAIAGWDTALSAINIAGLGGQAGIFAENTLRAKETLENTMRIIVGNTDAIKSSADAALTWAENLIAVRGEYSRLDELVEKGLITGESGIFDVDTQYAKAQDAYDAIAASVERIKDNLDTVQAMQAPFIAEVVEGTAAWTEELRKMDEQTQRTVLAFMDMQTVQQAQELITLGNSEAFRQMGEDGQAAFEATVRGALQINPLLFDVLETMGIISGTPLDFDVNYDALTAAGSEMDNLTENIGNLVDTLREIYGLPPISIEVDADTSGAEAKIQNLMSFASPVQRFDEDPSGYGAPGSTAGPSVQIEAVDNASPVITEVQSAIDAIPETVTTTIVASGYEEAAEGFASVQASAEAVPTSVTTWALVSGHIDAIGALNGVQAAADAIPTSVTTWTLVAGSDEAIGYLNGVQQAADAIPDSVTTWTLVTGHLEAITALNAVRAAVNAIPTSVTVSVNAVASSMPRFSAHASGGFVRSDFQLVGEDGPELVQLPYGSYVHTASQTRSMMAGISMTGSGNGRAVTIAPNAVNITVNAETDADAEEIAEVAGQRVMTALHAVIGDEYRSRGIGVQA